MTKKKHLQIICLVAFIALLLGIIPNYNCHDGLFIASCAIANLLASLTMGLLVINFAIVSSIARNNYLRQKVTIIKVAVTYAISLLLAIAFMASQICALFWLYARL